MADAIEGTAAVFERVRTALASVVVGQTDVVAQVLLCLLAGGHALLEGAPGLGKTLLVRALASATGLRFSRIQFTPDLLPADVLGTQMVTEDNTGRKRFELVRGPVFGQLVLADEINRATPRTQSALLEAMQEQQVTIAGQRHGLEAPFTVMATENPIEMEGTYPLPEAQLDRFLFKIEVPRPDPATMVAILSRTTSVATPMPEPVTNADALCEAQRLCRDVAIATPLLERVSQLLRALDPADRDAHPKARTALRMGPGVRGGQAMVLAAKASALLRGAANVSLDDLERVALPALRHRMILSFEGETEHVRPDALVEEVMPATLRATGTKP